MSESAEKSVTVMVEDRPSSVAAIFLDRIESTPDAEAYRFPVLGGRPGGDAGTEGRESGAEPWESLTWAQAGQRVKHVAAGLMDLGVRPEERVAISCSTRVEWILADFGILCAGAATTTIYPSTNAEESAYILADSGSRILVAEDAAQLAKVRGLREQLPDLTHVVVVDGTGVPDDDSGWVLSLAELERRGATYLEAHPTCVADSVAALRPDQLATLIYTSGTTGRPKGVRLVHDTWSYMARGIEATELINAQDVQYLWLPLAHVFGKVLLAAQVGLGHVTAVDGRQDRIAANLPLVRPTFMCAVPRVFEKVYNGMAAKAREGGPTKYKIFKWAAGVAREYARVTQENQRRTGTPSAPFRLARKHALADRLVYSKLRAAFGGNLRACCSGSAALSPEIGYFFSGAGIHILEGYGLTESSAASFVNPAVYRTGTVGKPLPGTEVRLAEDGEVLLRGPGIMEGYHGQPEMTEEVLDPDGWLHTGDIGELSEDGFLTITDRKKDLIKTSNGKYVAPTEVEGQLKAICPFVSNVVVHGAGRNFCSALIALDEPSITTWAEENGLGHLSYSEIVAAPQVRELLEGYVARLNEGLQRWQTIKKFAVLPRDLDLEHGEVTPSQKVKRAVVERNYAHLLEEMYAGTREA